MSCSFCENYVDLGMERSDIRAKYEILEPCGDPDDPEYDPEDTEVTARITIGVTWAFGPCTHCGESGQIPEPHWYVQGPGKRYDDLPGENSAYAVLEERWPNATPEPVDEDWESERPLRIAEGWGCPGD